MSFRSGVATRPILSFSSRPASHSSGASQSGRPDVRKWTKTAEKVLVTAYLAWGRDWDIGMGDLVLELQPKRLL